MKYKSIRAWLEHNKVLFETVAATLLSVMAIIVSIAQTKTAYEQTRLLSVQTQIAEAQALPQFDIAIHQKLNETTSKYDDDYLVISNHGGPVHEFSAQDAYSVEVTIAESPTKMARLEIPVGGYFTASYVSIASTGELVTMIGNHNNATVVALINGLRDAARTRGLLFANLDEHLIVQLRYRDLLNRFHEDFYEVKPVSGGVRLPDEVGKARFDKWIAAQHAELAQLRPDNLIDQVRQTGTAP
jgi:hypothetical protein